MVHYPAGCSHDKMVYGGHEGMDMAINPIQAGCGIDKLVLKGPHTIHSHLRGNESLQSAQCVCFCTVGGNQTTQRKPTDTVMFDRKKYFCCCSVYQLSTPHTRLGVIFGGSHGLEELTVAKKLSFISYL